MRLPLLLASQLCICLALNAEEKPWSSQVATVDGVPVQTLSTTDAAPYVFRLTTLPGSSLTLAAGSQARLTRTGQDKDQVLLIELVKGAAQFDLAGKGPYKEVLVRGAAIEVHVTGTLFCVERADANSDYVALIRGQVKVNLREAVAKALNLKEESVELNDRMGLGGSTNRGMGATTNLTARPQLDGAASKRASIQSQATASGVSDGQWGVDKVASGSISEPAQALQPADFLTRFLHELSGRAAFEPLPQEDSDTRTGLLQPTHQPLAKFPDPPPRQ